MPATIMLEHDILRDLGLDRLPPEKQEEAFAQIGRIIYQGVLIRALDRLSPAEQREFETVLNDHPDDEQALVSYLQRKVPDLDALIEEEVAKFKQETASILRAQEKDGS